MKLQDLIIEFLRENRFVLTERYLDDRPNKLIRFVKGSYRYSIVFSNSSPTLHLFKEKTNTRKPYGKVAVTHGGPKKKVLDYDRNKIVIDMNNKDSLKQILDFV